MTHGGGVLSMRASVGAAWAGLSGEWRHRGQGPARRADVKQAAAFCAGEFATFAVSRKGSEFEKVTSPWVRTCLPVFSHQPTPASDCFSVPIYSKSSPPSHLHHPVEYQAYPSPHQLTKTCVVFTAISLAKILYYFLSSSRKT